MAAVYFYIKNGQRLGPVEGVDLKKLAEAGELVPEDLLWKDGMASWEPARTVKGLFDPPRPQEGIHLPSSAPPPMDFDSRVMDYPRPPSLFGTIWFGLPTFLLALAAFIMSLIALLRGN